MPGVSVEPLKYSDRDWDVPEELKDAPPGLTPEEAAKFAEHLYAIAGDQAAEYAKWKIAESVMLEHDAASRGEKFDGYEQNRCWFLIMGEVDRIRGLYKPEKDTRLRLRNLVSDRCKRWERASTLPMSGPLDLIFHDLAEVDLLLCSLQDGEVDYSMEWLPRNTMLDSGIGSAPLIQEGCPMTGDAYFAISNMWVSALFDFLRVATGQEFEIQPHEITSRLETLKRETSNLRSPLAKLQVSGKRKHFYPNKQTFDHDRSTFAYEVETPNGELLNVSRRELADRLLEALGA